jgi:hypothetical protein
MVLWRSTCKTEANGFRAKLLLWRARQLARFRGTWRAFNTREIRKQLSLLLLQPVIVRLRIRERFKRRVGTRGGRRPSARCTSGSEEDDDEP